ncbi:MAG: V-type ATPase subunit [Candidatus Hydrogenedentes bacterium]|nr:V-type ATPase subunit [Candidatus Hydrogenedentota bacterium]
MAELDPNIVHFNARVHGMKRELFASRTVDDFLEQGDLARFTDALLDSAYRTEMAEALTRYSGADAIEEAVSRNMVSTFQLLLGRAQGEFKELVRIFLERWDLMAVKSLLRCKHHRIEGRTLAGALISGPTLTPPLLADFNELDSVESLARSLAAWNRSLCGCLLKALPDYAESNDLSVLEQALDRTYFVGQAERLKAAGDLDSQMLRGQLQAEIDRINLRTVFQHIETRGNLGESLDSLFLPQGTLPRHLLRQMASASDPAAAMELLGRTRYSSLVEELYQLLQTRRFSPMERYFERVLMKNVRQSARNNVFGIGVMMDFAWMKYNEAVNLRLVARGLAGNLPKGRVRDEMYAI